MKTTHGVILALVMAAAVPLTCWPAEQEQENFWQDKEPQWRPGQRRWELTEQRIERIMHRLREVNPEKAEELEKLRNEDPERFTDELRNIMREQLTERVRQEKAHRPGERLRRPPEEMGPMRPGQPNQPGRPAPPRPARPRARTRPLGYRHWLEENYPEEAERLAELKEKNPDAYKKKFGLSYRRYREIYRAARDNPQLAEVLKKDLELKEKRDQLLQEIQAATEESEKNELVKELEEVIGSRFDLIVRRKQMEYERLFEKIEQLKKELKQSEASVEKWKDASFRRASVRAHVEELVGGTRKFEWD